MTRSSRTDAPPPSTAPTVLRVDRVLCTGHGICASLLPGSIELDEWGYPVVLAESGAGTDDGPEARAAAVRWCPAMALSVDRGR